MPFPQSIFVTFFNTGSAGELLITYKYLDQDPEDAKDLQGVLWEIEDTKIINEEADLTRVFIIAGCAGVAILIVTIVVCVYLRNERQTNKVAMQERNTGVAMWGSKPVSHLNISQETIEEKLG